MKNLVCALFILCTLVIPVAVSASVRITEIMYDSDGADSKREWIEVYNDGPDAVNFAEWKFIDKVTHVLNTPPKNGGVGYMLVAPGRYVVLASDAATFLGEYPNRSLVFDTTMSLNNSGASIGIKSVTAIADSVTYSKSQGASDDGDSLQLHDGAWIHAQPTPGEANATRPSVHAAPIAAKSTVAKPAPKKPTSSIAKAVAEESSNDPIAIVNATPTEGALSQTAAASSLGGSIWWLAAGALAVGTGAAASLISRTKKTEWDIEESE